MRSFNYSSIKEHKWDAEVLALIASIYRYVGKQELYLKQKPQKLEKLVEIAKIQSTEASNFIEGIVTTNTRIKQLVREKTTPRNRAEQEIIGYRRILGVALVEELVFRGYIFHKLLLIKGSKWFAIGVSSNTVAIASNFIR